ncbi:ankyrin repeat-containing protein BDA1-like [Quercus lobata]|uniref:ankyrin repeat-containing protein BDA1-like n=1 Tax=Quercus lobata TaxID=97700 RepID=UPI001245FFEF|nr:ankyrin repeat-containing protein BDA1-like [Quercus lobata]
MSAYSIIGERIVKLNAVALHGNIAAFYSLIIRENVRILEDIDELPFVDTPLHIAASAGGPQHIQFAMEMMRLKPSFARKLNLNGYSPIHLALQEGHTQMVRRLLQVDGDLVRVKGKEGRTPLHDVAAAAATEQQLALMDKFLSYNPNSIEDATIQNQTALHIALENNNLHAFKRLVRWLRKNKRENAREILNRQDEKGNTLLHVAVSKNQTEAVRKLLNCGVNLKARNLEGHTAQDMLQEQTQVNNSGIRDLLICCGALSCSLRPGILRKIVFFFERLRLLIKSAREGSKISNDDRNALLVVAALLITITYQVVITPPGGLWQDNETISSLHHAGTAIAQQTYGNFEIVATINYITFTLSAIMTFLLLPRGYISALFKMALIQLWASYYYSLAVILEYGNVLYYCLISTGLCFVLVLFAFFGRQFCWARIKCLHLHWIFYIVYACIMFLMALVGQSLFEGGRAR